MEEKDNKSDPLVIEELTNEVDEFIRQYTSGSSKKRRETYGGKSFDEQRKIFFEEKFAPWDKSPEDIVSKFHNPITHTAKVRQTSSGAHLQGRGDALIPEGYVTLSSTQTRESRDYAGAAVYATISKVMESTIDGQNKVKDLLNSEDHRLKDFLGFDEDRWKHLLEINMSSNVYCADPRPDGLTKQILFSVGPGDDYLNLTITPSPILLYEVNERIKERTRNNVGREWFSNMAVKKIGGNNPQNASRLISRISPGRSHLYILSSFPFTVSYKGSLDRFTRSSDFFWAIRYTPDMHRALFQPFDRLMETNERGGWTPNAKVQRALDNSLGYILEQTVLPSAISLQVQTPGWSDSDLVRLPEHQRKWLDPDNPEHDPQLDYRERIAREVVECMNRLYASHRRSSKKDPLDLTQDRYIGRFKEVIKRSL